MLQLTIGETRKGLEALADTITNGGTISAQEKAALASAIGVLTKLGTLQIIDWTSCEATDDGEPIPETEKEVRTALFSSDALDQEGFRLLMESDEILDDPRVLVTTPQKARGFLTSLGFKNKHTRPGS